MQFLGAPKAQYFQSGTADFLAGGKVYSYVAGTLTPKATYPSIDDALAGTNANTNPVILNSRGEATIVLKGATKIILKDANDVTLWTVDDLDSESINIIDANGNEVLKFVGVANAVNEITMTNAASTARPIIEATGGDANIGITVRGKGTGVVTVTSPALFSGSSFTSSATTNAIQGTSCTISSTTTTISSDTLTLTAVDDINVGASTVLNILPPGSVIWKASTTLPTGWLECNGAAVSRTTYANLFADIGTTYGSGDGSTTFNLPAQARRTLVGRGGSGTGTLANTVGATGGAETHTLSLAESPAHTHTYTDATANTGAVQAGGSFSAFVSPSVTNSTNSQGGGAAHNNMQPSLVMMMIIKY